MPYHKARWATSDVFRLMEIATAIAELSTDPQLLSEVPDLLADTLGLKQVAVGIVKQGREDTTGNVIFVAASAQQRADIETLRHTILKVHAHATSGPQGNDGPSVGLSITELDATPDREEVILVEGSSLRLAHGSEDQTVLTRVVDESHRLVVLAEHRTPDAMHHCESVQNLQMIADHMARILHLMLVWRTRPQDLGLPFVNLTEREWMVLWALYSDDGEKQMAERLKLSPHTLHSHIKSIYRKTGVQGRLQLIQRLRTGLNERRMRLLVGSSRAPGRAVAMAV